MRTIPVNVPRAVITLDRPRTMTMQLDALLRIQKETGSLETIDDATKIVENAPTIIWCCLVDGDREDITREEIGAMIHAGNLAEVVGALSYLVNGSNPTAKGAEGNALPVPAAVRRRASRPSR